MNFSPSTKFSPSMSFSSSMNFSPSRNFSPSMNFSQSMNYSPSRNFSPSMNFSPSIKFSPSSNFSRQKWTAGKKPQDKKPHDEKALLPVSLKAYINSRNFEHREHERNFLARANSTILSRILHDYYHSCTHRGIFFQFSQIKPNIEVGDQCVREP